MSAAIPETHFEVPQGDTVKLAVGPILVKNPATKVESPIDLTEPGMVLRFMAKLDKGDADVDAKISKSHGVPAGPGGISPDVPTTAEKNWATVTIDPAETDALAAPVTLFYDVQLVEPDGTKTTVRRGTIDVQADVTNA